MRLPLFIVRSRWWGEVDGVAAAETAAAGSPELVAHGGDSAGAVGPDVVDRKALAGGVGSTATRSGSAQAAMSP